VSELVKNFALKPSGACQCGCGKEGTYRVKPWRSGILCVRSCTSCASCRGRRAKKGGQYDQQSKGARELASKRGKNHEEADRYAFRWQNKKGKISIPIHNVWEKVEQPDRRPLVVSVGWNIYPSRLILLRSDHLAESWKLLEHEEPFYPTEKLYVQPVFTAFSKVEKDDEAMRPIGDSRPFIARFALPQSRHYALLIFRHDQLEAMHYALGIENGYIK